MKKILMAAFAAALGLMSIAEGANVAKFKNDTDQKIVITYKAQQYLAEEYVYIKVGGSCNIPVDCSLKIRTSNPWMIIEFEGISRAGTWTIGRGTDCNQSSTKLTIEPGSGLTRPQ